MTKLLLTGASVLLTVVGGGCSTVSAPLQDVSLQFTRAQLDEVMTEPLPFSRTYRSTYSISLTRTDVRLADGYTRIYIGHNIRLGLEAEGEKKNLDGNLETSVWVEYVPESARLHFNEPAIEMLAVQGIPKDQRKEVKGVILEALADYYAEYPFYELTSTDTKQDPAKLVVKSAVLENAVLAMRLGAPE